MYNGQRSVAKPSTAMTTSITTLLSKATIKITLRCISTGCDRNFELTSPLAMKVIKSNPFFYFIFYLFEFYRLCSRESTPLLGLLTKTIQPFLLGN